MYAGGVYIQYVRYEWDEVKREQTLAERGIDFQAIEGFEWGDLCNRAERPAR